MSEACNWSTLVMLMIAKVLSLKLYLSSQKQPETTRNDKKRPEMSREDQRRPEETRGDQRRPEETRGLL